MSIPFNEIVMPDKPKTKEQILAEMKRTWRKPVYFYDGRSNGEMAHYELSARMEDDEPFEDVPF